MPQDAVTPMWPPPPPPPSFWAPWLPVVWHTELNACERVVDGGFQTL